MFGRWRLSKTRLGAFAATGALMTAWAAVPPVERIGDLVRGEAAASPDRVAIIEADRRITYAQLDDLVERCTAALVAAGCQRGQRLAMVTDASLGADRRIPGVCAPGRDLRRAEPTP